MGQKVKIQRVRVNGFVYVDEDHWTQSGAEVMEWLSSGWRGLFNNFREPRVKRDDQIEPLTKTEYKASAEYRKALPVSVLRGVQNQESSEWFSAWKRRKSVGGRIPNFKRRKDGVGFSLVGTQGAELRTLSKCRSEIVITGRNPPGKYGPGSTVRWSIRIQFRHTQAIRPYSSAHVRWSKGTISFTNVQPPVERTETGSVVGIDVGITHTLTTSNSEHFDIPKASRAEVSKYKRLQRKLARQDRTNESRSGRASKFLSKRRQRTLESMRRISSSQVRRRHDWVEKITTQLIRDYDSIFLEALSSTKLSRWGGRSKSGLNRGILESCWGAFQMRLTQKAEASGVYIGWVNPAYTSQTCNKCGYASRENRESQAVFKCVRCSHSANADTNAARNILDIGLGHSLKRGANIRPGDPESSDLGELGSGREALTDVEIAA